MSREPNDTTRSSTRSPNMEQAGASDNIALHGAATNYGVQVSYNAGTISNYFCFNSDTVHRCDLPRLATPHAQSERHLYEKVEKARRRFKSGRWGEAKILFYETLHPRHPPQLSETDRILTQYNLAHAHFALAEFNDAANHFGDLVQVHEELNKEPTQSVNDSQYWLARCFFHRGKFEDAANQLQIFILTRNLKDPQAGEQITNGRLWLGLSFQMQKDFENARAQLIGAYDSSVQDVGERHLETLTCRHHLANFLYMRKEFSEALEHFQALLEAEMQLSGPERGAAIQTRCMLAFTLAKLGRLCDAEQHLQRVSSWMNVKFAGQELMFEELRDVGLVNYWLGRIAVRRRDFLAAENKLREALDALSALKERVKFDHANDEDGLEDLDDNIIECRRLLAHTMYDRGQYPVAEQAFREILNDLSENRDEDRMGCLKGLAYSLLAQRKNNEVESTLREINSKTHLIKHNDRSSFDDDRNDLYDCVFVLGLALRHLEQEDESRSCFQQLVQVVPTKPNMRHNRTRTELAICLFTLEAYSDSLSISHLATTNIRYLIDNALVSEQASSHCLKRATMVYSWSQCEIGHLDEAEHHLRHVLTAEPEKNESFLYKAVSQYYLGRVLMSKRESANAIKSFRDADTMLKKVRVPRVFSGKRLLCRYYTAYCLFRSSQYGEAKHIFEDFLQVTTPTIGVEKNCIVSAQYWLGRISASQGRLEDAAKYFAECFEALCSEPNLPLHPDIPNVNVLTWQADSLLLRRMYDDAIEIARKAMAIITESKEDLAWASKVLGQGLYFTNQFDEACKYLQTALSIHQEAWGHDANKNVRIRAFLADSLCELSRDAEATSMLLELAEHHDDTVIFAKPVANYWLGRRAFHRGDLKDAATRFSLAKAMLAGKIEFWDRIRLDCAHFAARILFAESKYTEASARFQELAKQQYASGHLNHATDNQYYLGLSLLEEKKQTEARSVLQKILDDRNEGRLVRPAAFRARYPLGRCLVELKVYEEAKVHLETVIENAKSCHTTPALPSEYTMKTWLARCTFNLGLFEEALAHYEFITAKEAGSCTARKSAYGYWLGRTLFALNRHGEAVPHFQKAWDTNKAGSERQYFLARAQFEAGKYKEAATNFKAICDDYQSGKPPVTLRTRESLDRCLNSYHYLGLTAYNLRDYRDARKSLEFALAERTKRTPFDEVAIMKVTFDLVRCMVNFNSKKHARELFTPLIPFFEKRGPEGDETIVYIRLELAILFAQSMLWDSAFESYDLAMGDLTLFNDRSDIDVLPYQASWVRLLVRSQQRYKMVKLLARNILDGRKAAAKPVCRAQIELQLYLCEALCYLGEFDEVASLSLEALEWREQLGGPIHVIWPLRLTLARVAYHHLDLDTAEELYQKALSKIKPDQAPPSWAQPVATLHAMLAMTLLKLGRPEEAQKRAEEALQCERPERWPDYPELSNFLVEFVPMTVDNVDDKQDRGERASANQLPVLAKSQQSEQHGTIVEIGPLERERGNQEQKEYEASAVKSVVPEKQGEQIQLQSQQQQQQKQQPFNLQHNQPSLVQLHLQQHLPRTELPFIQPSEAITIMANHDEEMSFADLLVAKMQQEQRLHEICQKLQQREERERQQLEADRGKDGKPAEKDVHETTNQNDE